MKTKLSIRRNWTSYVDIIFEDGTLVSTKGGRTLCRTRAHGAFYAGTRSTLQVLAYMLDHGDIDELHRTIAREGRQIKVTTTDAAEAATLKAATAKKASPAGGECMR